MSRPHADPRLVASVAAGGALGSLARYGLSHALPSVGGWPVATLTENLLGAFLLGLLLETLGRAGAETPRRRWLRLTLGTGVLGGFTTYSALALETHGLLAEGRAGMALGYALLTVLGGTVNGAHVYGTFPGLATAQLYEGTDVAVTTDYRRVISEALIRRMGNPNIYYAFPGYSGYAPLGIFQGTDLPPSNYDAIFKNGFDGN